MKFPNICHIDQVETIGLRDEFHINKKEGYTVIDYSHVLPDSFDCPVRRECRGLKFYPDGYIMSRPLHKFFNITEKPDEDPKFDGDVVVKADKLDGSMVHGVVLNGKPRLMTRAGITDVSQMAEKHMSLELCKFICSCCYGDGGITPIFEFTSPANRIVVKYEKSLLRLIAIRHNTTGEYLDVDDVRQGCFSIPIVDWVSVGKMDMNSRAELITAARAEKGCEGYVFIAGDGRRWKVKNDDYVLKHRAKSYFESERNTLELILRGETDDYKTILDYKDRIRVEEYESRINNIIDDIVVVAEDFCDDYSSMDQKQFALLNASMTEQDPIATRGRFMESLCFAVRGGRDSREVTVNMILKSLSNSQRFSKLKWITGSLWDDLS